ncbi:MAG: hypothetical protein JST42_29030 [Bacteroidetes bacterium]|nr:hypothetical protein [Bacteroidota bacterium]
MPTFARMGYVRITILLRDGSRRSGVRRCEEPMVLEDIRAHAFHLAAEVLGRTAIDEVTVEEVPATDAAVVALILDELKRSKPIPRSDGVHPYLKEQQRRPPR